MALGPVGPGPWALLTAYLVVNELTGAPVVGGLAVWWPGPLGPGPRKSALVAGLGGPGLPGPALMSTYLRFYYYVNGCQG